MDDLITTTEAARIAGVGVTSIKRWADQELIRVTRTPGGHRRVDKHDLLRFVGSLEGARTTTEDAGSWADVMLNKASYALQSALLDARGRTGSWFPVADEVGRGVQRMGDRWAHGKISVLDEHIASERLARALAAIAESMPLAGRAPACLMASAPGDEHTLGLSLLQPCLAEAGWSALWAGRSTPVDDLCDVATSGRVAMLAVSASVHTAPNGELGPWLHKLESACAASGVHLVLGGSGAWPEDTRHARRFHTFVSFRSFISDVA